VPSSPHERHETPEPLGNGERVMLIDADPGSRERCEDWLAEMGFEPLGYADAQEAFDASAHADDDLALVIAAADSLPANEIAFAARVVVLSRPIDRESLARAAASALKDFS
jgi:DNA-binding response OmpR family regulator